MGRNRGNLRVNCSALIEGDVGISGLLCGGQHSSQGQSSAVQRGLLQGEARGSKHSTVQSALRLNELWFVISNTIPGDYANSRFLLMP